MERLNGASITFDEFCTLIDRELEDLSGGPRQSIILNTYSKSRRRGPETTEHLDARGSGADSAFTFKPRISSRSRQIAEQMGRGSSAEIPIFELLYTQKGRRDMQIKAERTRLEEKEMQECTFKPRLIANNSKYANIYNRIPGNYASPLKLKGAQVDNPKTEEKAYHEPDIWSPSHQTGRGFRTNGPEMVFGRRDDSDSTPTHVAEASFPTMESSESAQVTATVEVPADFSQKPKSEKQPILRGGGGKKFKVGHSSTPAESPQPKDVQSDGKIETEEESSNGAAMPDLASPSAQDANAMQPNFNLGESGEEESLQSIEDVLAQVRAVTQADNSLGYQ